LEWLHEGCDSDLSADFLHFGASDFLFKNPFKKCFKIVLFSLWHRDILQFNISILHCNGYVKVAWCRGCMRNTIVFCSWTLQIVLEWLHQGCDGDLSVDFLDFGAGDFPFRNFF